MKSSMTRFIKAHACGNDFLIVEGAPDVALATRLCARNTGIGADGIEFLSRTGERAGSIHLINADGSFAEISGNGTRCVAALLAYRSEARPGDAISLATGAGPRICRIVRAEGSRFEIASAMGIPQVAGGAVTLAGGAEIQGAVVSTGNPHFVIFVENENFTVHNRPWQDIGREICFHSDFPQQTNVEFVRITGTDSIEIRIFERGAGPTASSGTGTCASAAASIVRGLSTTLTVVAPGGPQQVDWPSRTEEMLLTGPAELIAAGEVWA